jgi:hypothetical protein
MIQLSLINGFGLAITWNKSEKHDFAIIFLCFAIIFKKNKAQK